MSRLLVRSAIRNLGRLTNSGASASLKSKGILRVACQGVVRCESQLMSSMNTSCDAASNVSNKEFVARLEESVLEYQDKIEPVGSRIGNFEVTSIKDTKVELKGKYLGKELEIMFNINGVERFEHEEEPKFDVDLTVKCPLDSFYKFHIKCHFQGVANKDGLGECIKVRDFAVTTWLDKNIIFTGVSLDENISKYLLNLINKKGINSEFTISLRDWILNHNNFLYVNKLKDLKNFISP